MVFILFGKRRRERERNIICIGITLCKFYVYYEDWRTLTPSSALDCKLKATRLGHSFCSDLFTMRNPQSVSFSLSRIIIPIYTFTVKFGVFLPLYQPGFHVYMKQKWWGKSDRRSERALTVRLRHLYHGRYVSATIYTLHMLNAHIFRLFSSYRLGYTYTPFIFLRFAT